MKRRATGLLIVVTAVFVALAAVRSSSGWVSYALAAAEGSMVGGLADWFAVTALFRHPLGLPIPHTAVIRERKDQFGETLGQFIQQNFLSSDIVAERIRAARGPARLAAWLVQPANAGRVAKTFLEGVAAVADLVGDDDVHRLLHDEIERIVQSVPFGTLAGRALSAAIDEQRHHPLVDATLRGTMKFLEEQREPLRVRFGQASPWWLPGAVEDRIFDRIIDGALLLLASIAADPDHEIRAQLDDRLRQLAARLEHEPETADKVQVAVTDILAHPDVRAWTRRLWTDAKAALHVHLDDDQSRLRAGLADVVITVGGRLAEDEALQARLAGAAETGVRYVTEHHGDEISSLVSATIARWNAEETSSKLELLLGRDLQFIRINGTVVGGLAGLGIHAVAAWL